MCTCKNIALLLLHIQVSKMVFSIQVLIKFLEKLEKKIKIEIKLMNKGCYYFGVCVCFQKGARKRQIGCCNMHTLLFCQVQLAFIVEESTVLEQRLLGALYTVFLLYFFCSLPDPGNSWHKDRPSTQISCATVKWALCWHGPAKTKAVSGSLIILQLPCSCFPVWNSWDSSPSQHYLMTNEATQNVFV